MLVNQRRGKKRKKLEKLQSVCCVVRQKKIRKKRQSEMTDGDVESSMNLQVTTEGKFEHNKKKKINAQVEFPL